MYVMAVIWRRISFLLKLSGQAVSADQIKALSFSTARLRTKIIQLVLMSTKVISVVKEGHLVEIWYLWKKRNKEITLIETWGGIDSLITTITITIATAIILLLLIIIIIIIKIMIITISAAYGQNASSSSAKLYSYHSTIITS